MINVHIKKPEECNYGVLKKLEVLPREYEC